MPVTPVVPQLPWRTEPRHAAIGQPALRGHGGSPREAHPYRRTRRPGPCQQPGPHRLRLQQQQLHRASTARSAAQLDRLQPRRPAVAAATGTRRCRRSHCASGSLTGAGSSFQDPMQQQWSKDFAAKCSGAKVDYQPVGSGAGIQQFGAGTIDYAGSDVADEDRRAGRRRQVVRQPGPAPARSAPAASASPGTCPTSPTSPSPPPTLADIFDGKIKTWNDPEIKTDNPSATLPSTADLGRLPGRLLRHQRRLHRLPRGRGQEQLDARQRQDHPVADRHRRPEERRRRRGQGQADPRCASPTSSRPTRRRTSCRWPRSRTAPPRVALTTDSVTAAIAGATITGTGNNLVATVNFAPTDPAAYPISTLTLRHRVQQVPERARSKVVRCSRPTSTYAAGPVARPRPTASASRRCLPAIAAKVSRPPSPASADPSPQRVRLPAGPSGDRRAPPR